jgi:hypothetical protein
MKPPFAASAKLTLVSSQPADSQGVHRCHWTMFEQLYYDVTVARLVAE